jgi:hypothetical protein
MASAEQYAQWIVDNQDKRGTEQFNIVAQAYQQARAEVPAPTAVSASAFPSTPGPATYEWSEVPLEALSNLPSSTYNLVATLVEAVASPVDTAKAIGNIMYGGLQKALPDRAEQFIGKDQESLDAFNSLADFYAGRYGSEEGFKKAVAEDPAGILADLASVLTGAGAGARAAGLGATAQRLAKTASVIEPVTATARAAGAIGGKAVSGALGRTTGVGASPIVEAFKAGIEGGERGTGFTQAMRSGNIEPVLEAAKQNLNALKEKRSQQYASGMADVAESTTPLSFEGIYAALDSAKNRYKFIDEVVDETALAAVQSAYDKVNNWSSLPPELYHTPIGMDQLKRQIYAISDQLPIEQKNARAAISDVYNAVKSDIAKQAPIYSQVMRGYTEASELISEIERTLLNPKATVDTQLRKLASVMRNNVNTNFGQRQKLLDELEGQPNALRAPLAGASLSDAVPRGIQGATMGLTGLGAYGVGGLPYLAGAAVTSSPRVVGEATYAAGRAASPLATIPADALRRFPHLRGIQDPRALMAAYQAAVASSAAQGNR